jgi:hypothetical protein
VRSSITVPPSFCHLGGFYVEAFRGRGSDAMKRIG